MRIKIDKVAEIKRTARKINKLSVTKVLKSKKQKIKEKLLKEEIKGN